MVRCLIESLCKEKRICVSFGQVRSVLAWSFSELALGARTRQVARGDALLRCAGLTGRVGGHGIPHLRPFPRQGIAHARGHDSLAVIADRCAIQVVAAGMDRPGWSAGGVLTGAAA